jgi:5-methylcytosine-specific restriction endonuclease McrA
MAYSSKDIQRTYQRVWWATRKAEGFRELGNKCALCETSENLELDHVVPQSKTSHKIWSWSESRRKEELAKCQLLCRKCHLWKTISPETFPPTENEVRLMPEIGIDWRDVIAEAPFRSA